MRRIASGVLAIVVLLSTPGLAALREVTVRQLASMLASARASHLPDNEVAAQINGLELTERLTEPTLATLWSDQGGLTKFALWVLAGKSAFLDPPAVELPAGQTPKLAEWTAILARAAEYTAGYVHNLPNFTCKQVIRRFQNNPYLALANPDAGVGALYGRDVVENTLTFNKGREFRQVLTVNGQAWKEKKSVNGLTTWGEFGSIIASVFVRGSAAKVEWSHWETVAARRVAVVNYVVDRRHSSFSLSWCCTPRSPSPRVVKVAYKGALFIEPSSGAVLRVTRQAIDIPSDFPTRRSDTVVEYRDVDIGGKPWLGPVRSITISEAQVSRARIYALNEVQFTDYHKFESSSTLIIGDLAEEAPPTDLPSPPPVRAEAPARTAIAPRVPAELESPPVLKANAASPGFVPAPPSLPPPPSVPPTPELPVDSKAIFRVRTNVVNVRVVVRDRNGYAVGDLRKDEFELRDNGQPQTISSFSVEKPAAADVPPILTKRSANAGNEQQVAHQALTIPDRYVMYVLDDLNLAFGDLSQTRAAAEQVLQESPDAASRVAVLTTSGRIVLDFTSNLTKVDDALKRITPQGRANVESRCPPLSNYLAYRIVELEDEMALSVARSEAASCGAVIDVRFIAEQVLSEYSAQTRAVLEALKAAARRISIMPGLRTIVLVSPGFLTPDLESQVNQAIDRAVRAGVVINTLDARGVWALPGFDAETRGLSTPTIQRLKRQYDEQEQHLQSDILIHLADGTGGSISRDNDFAGGFRRLTAAPEVSYVLGFTPSKLKADGSFHKLKVTVGARKGLTVQARNGYFAPKHNVDPAEQAKEEIENAVFSRDEIQDIPVTLRASVAGGKLSAVAHFDLSGSRSRVTATVSLFDAAGNYLKGVQDVIDQDSSARAVRADFDAPPGTYVVRLVLRDNDGHMSATSKNVEVP
jgi:VWFA-related protein